MKWTVTLTRMEVTTPAVSDFIRHFVLYFCCFWVSSFCFLCVHVLTALFNVAPSSCLSLHVFAVSFCSVVLMSQRSLLISPDFSWSFSSTCFALNNPWPWAESCCPPSSFSPHCESFTLPHFLNWETRHSIAGQWVIGFQRRLKLETLIPRISESRELQIPYHLH